jgi:hypothetical protein
MDTTTLEAQMARKTFFRSLTTDDIESGLDSPDFEGYGYLGERGRHGRIGDMQIGDAALLDRANELRWTADELVAFVVSKAGRWYADEVFGSGVRSSVNPLQLRSLADRAIVRYTK